MILKVARLAKLPHLASASPSGLLQSTWLPSPALSPLLPLPRPHAAAACGCGFDAQRGPPRGQRPQQLRQQRWQLRPFFPSWPKSFSMMNHKGANGQDDMYRNSIYEKSDWPAMVDVWFWWWDPWRPRCVKTWIGQEFHRTNTFDHPHARAGFWPCSRHALITQLRMARHGHTV